MHMTGLSQHMEPISVWISRIVREIIVYNQNKIFIFVLYMRSFYGIHFIFLGMVPKKILTINLVLF